MTATFKFLAPKHEYKWPNGGWSRRVEIAGVEYIVGIERGRRVRIAYKPRGPTGWGFHWHGFVRDAKGRTIWTGRVNKSTGVKMMLLCSGLVVPDPEPEIPEIPGVDPVDG